MLKRLFKPRATQVAGQALYASAVAQARTPALYADYRAPDTVEGRFELYSLHVYLLLERMKGQGVQAADTAQVLFDTYLSGLDHALRELGVGDTVVGKRMRRLGEAFYGRVNSLEAAMGALPDRTLLDAMLARTTYADVADADVGRLGDYLLAQRETLAGQSLEALCAGQVQWHPA